MIFFTTFLFFVSNSENELMCMLGVLVVYSTLDVRSSCMCLSGCSACVYVCMCVCVCVCVSVCVLVCVRVTHRNVGNAPPPDDLSGLFPHDAYYDVYVIAVQECHYDPLRDHHKTAKGDFNEALVRHFGRK